MMIQMDSPAWLRGLFWPFDHDLVAWCRLRMKSQSSPRRFSTPLALSCGCANLRQNRRHNATNLSRRDHLPPAFPGTIAGLSQRACQQQLVHHDTHDLAPTFKLFWSSHLCLLPEQVLLQVPVAMLLGKASLIAADHLCQSNTDWMVSEADKPTFTRIAFVAFGSLPLHTKHADLHLACLPEMQPAPSVDFHQMTAFIVAQPNRFGSQNRLRPCPRDASGPSKGMRPLT